MSTSENMITSFREGKGDAGSRDERSDDVINLQFSEEDADGPEASASC